MVGIFINRRKNRGKIGFFPGALLLITLIVVFGIMGRASALWFDSLAIQENVETGYMLIEDGYLVVDVIYETYDGVDVPVSAEITLPIINNGTIPAKFTGATLTLDSLNILTTLNGELLDGGNVLDGLDPGEQAELKLEPLVFSNFNGNGSGTHTLKLELGFEQWNTSDSGRVPEGEGWDYTLEYIGDISIDSGRVPEGEGWDYTWNI